MDKTKYTDFGLFDNKEDAMLFRNNNYRFCSCWYEKEGNKIRLLIKLPR